ncbi:MAG TPA: hypothetical protein VHT21_21055, partial [Stellaceae bacterium]|nr:hypothetical protein [Stellaceae bacterium]
MPSKRLYRSEVMTTRLTSRTLAPPTKAQAKVSVLHDGQCFIAAADGQEVGAPEEHGVITEQEAAAPQE